MEKVIKKVNNKKKIVILLGPSGSGKTTLGKELHVPRIITYSSKSPRLGEVDNLDYYFRTKEYIQNLYKEGKMVDYTEYAGACYGMSKDEIDKRFKQSDIIYAVTDVNGVKHLKKYYDNVYVIFIFADIETLKNRLIARKDSPEKIIKRLVNLEKERELENYVYADFTIYNNNYEYAKKQMKAIYEIIKED